MPVDRGDLVEAAGAEARDHAAYVPGRDELVLADGDRDRRGEDPARIDAVQIDGFRQTDKGLGPMAPRIIAAAGQKVALHREHEPIRLERGRAGEPSSELLAAAVSRHG